MRFRQFHSWDVNPSEARRIQTEMRSRLITSGSVPRLEYVAGADVSYEPGSSRVYAVVVVLEWPALEVVEIRGRVDAATFPYIPGLLSFREGKPVMKAWSDLVTHPSVVLFDGHGLAHPRRLGLASHLGLLIDLPAVGCAKSRLIGEFPDPGDVPGAFSLLRDGPEVIGAALRTRRHVKPVLVSIGHKLSLEAAREVVWRCTRGYRLPEPTRQAHLLVNRLRRGEEVDFLKGG